MLTVDLERIGVGTGTRLLDVGCGTGRHAFAAWKAGGSVVALDASLDGLPGVVGMTDAMREADCRYVHSEGDVDWWVPSGRVFYSAAAGDGPDEELAEGRRQLRSMQTSILSSSKGVHPDREHRARRDGSGLRGVAENS